MYSRCGAHRSAATFRVAVLRSRSLADVATTSPPTSFMDKRSRELEHRQIILEDRLVRLREEALRENVLLEEIPGRYSRSKHVRRPVVVGKGSPVRAGMSHAHFATRRVFADRHARPRNPAQSRVPHVQRVERKSANSRMGPTLAHETIETIKSEFPSQTQLAEETTDNQEIYQSAPRITIDYGPNLANNPIAQPLREQQRTLDPQFRFGKAYAGRPRTLFPNLSERLIQVAQKEIWKPGLRTRADWPLRMSRSMLNDIGKHDFRQNLGHSPSQGSMTEEESRKYAHLYLGFQKVGNLYLDTVLELLFLRHFPDDFTSVMVARAKNLVHSFPLFKLLIALRLHLNQVFISGFSDEMRIVMDFVRRSKSLKGIAFYRIPLSSPLQVQAAIQRLKDLPRLPSEEANFIPPLPQRRDQAALDILISATIPFLGARSTQGKPQQDVSTHSLVAFFADDVGWFVDICGDIFFAVMHHEIHEAHSSEKKRPSLNASSYTSSEESNLSPSTILKKGVEILRSRGDESVPQTLADLQTAASESIHRSETSQKWSSSPQKTLDSPASSPEGPIWRREPSHTALAKGSRRKRIKSEEEGVQHRVAAWYKSKEIEASNVSEQHGHPTQTTNPPAVPRQPLASESRPQKTSDIKLESLTGNSDTPESKRLEDLSRSDGEDLMKGMKDLDVLYAKYARLNANDLSEKLHPRNLPWSPPNGLDTMNSKPIRDENNPPSIKPNTEDLGLSIKTKPTENKFKTPIDPKDPSSEARRTTILENKQEPSTDEKDNKAHLSGEDKKDKPTSSDESQEPIMNSETKLSGPTEAMKKFFNVTSWFGGGKS
ncbi:hypothetical protein AA313_de0204595 [Arthrobotrys entomopaga]|nr:hypothetical protein AA313_de0204595 [Arthrobotrys entomopaga]